MMLSKPQPPGTDDADAARPRLSLLYAHAEEPHRPELNQLGRLLEPMGIRSIEIESGQAAADLIEQRTFHIAVIDWAVPLRADDPTSGPAGPRLLQVLRRLTAPPPTIVVRPAQPERRESVRGLSEALREGAFAVIDRPVHLETLLEVLRRIIARHYAGCWPTKADESNGPTDRFDLA